MLEPVKDAAGGGQRQEHLILEVAEVQDRRVADARPICGCQGSGLFRKAKGSEGMIQKDGVVLAGTMLNQGVGGGLPGVHAPASFRVFHDHQFGSIG